MVGIEMKDVIKVYRTGDLEVIALRGVTASITSGRAVALMGPSGCGKSTLLNLIAGLDRCTAGSIVLDGRNITRLPESDLVRHRRETVGIVFQFFNLVPTLSAEENIELPMRLAGKPSELREKRTRGLLQLVGLEKRAVHRPDELSGGEQQRVAIAVALANDPPIVLADEPTGELDTKTGEEILALFRRLNGELRKTVLVVTHDARVAGIAHRVLQIQDGKIVGEAARN